MAFINFSGIQLLLDTLKNCEEKEIKGKILTSTYLNFTEVKALEKLNKFSNLEIKIFDTSVHNIGFHSKAYIFEFEDEYKILLGSSNITASAFKSNIEWNIKSVSKKDDVFSKKIKDEFYKLWDKSFFINDDFLAKYENFKQNIKQNHFIYKQELKANFMQEQALKNLENLRKEKENKALAIASTGSGKTILAAFDVKNFDAKRLLFIVHRGNILLRAKESFENIIPNKTMGLFTGNKKDLNAQYIFASIQSLNTNLHTFKSDDFNYIIIDEAHHIASPSYEKVIKYFKPKFTLGLTATPNRMDENSIYKYFDENIACDIRLGVALEHKLIAPFHYYGISDLQSIDYGQTSLLDIPALAKLLMVNKRVDYIVEKMNFYSFSGKKRKVLAFCISKAHALYMSEEFNKRGIKSACLLGEDSISKREKYISKLEDDSDDLEIICTVDIFNEGLDIPSVNTVLMLRPTNSSIIFIQQLGRGLRKAKDKDFLTVLDFIGNHDRAYLVSLALMGKKKIDKDSLKLSLENNYAHIPNAFIQMDKIAKKRILEQIEKENFSKLNYLKEQYFIIKNQLGKIPRFIDFYFYEEYFTVLDFIHNSKSYFEFLLKVEKNDKLKLLAQNERFIKTIRFCESLLPIKRIYEFVILLYLCENDKINEKIAHKILKKYLQRVDENTIKHSFKFLNQNFFDKTQVQRYEKLVEFENNSLKRSESFEKILKIKEYKAFIKDCLEYGILNYERSLSRQDYGLPFLKLYEKYNMLNIAQVCNFDKIHSSFRGSGFLKYKNDFFLFMTIEKDKFSKASKYENIFYSKEDFTYFSKPTHYSDKGDGYKLCHNKKEKVKLHIFVRKFTQVDKKTQAFIYLGLANTISYAGNKPIKCTLKLENPLDDFLYEEFTKIV